MHGVRPSHLALMVLFAVAVLVTRVGGTHLHLCFDGQEAPVSVHAGDSGAHHEHEGAEVSSEHNDRDIDVADAAAGKSGKKDSTDESLWAIAALLMVRLPRPARARVVRSAVIPDSVQAVVLPPLRGPPR